jgi:RES domain-containing protein
MRAVYTAESLALAALEMLVSVNPTELVTRFVAIAAFIPDDLARTVLRPEELPRDWRAYPAPQELQRRGDDWLRGAATAVLAVPSAIIPFETNFILNPAHPDFARVRIGEPLPFEFDPRLGTRSPD